jgi:hypothetical protein
MKEKTFGSKFVDLYFEKQCPYSRRRPFNLKNLGFTAGVLFILFVAVTIYFGGEKSSPQKPSRPDSQQNQNHSTVGVPPDVSGGKTKGQSSFYQDSMMGLVGHGRVGSGTSQGSRSYAASQVIRRGEGGNDPLTRLPLGSTLTAKLINSIISTNVGSPVIAEIPEDVLAHNTPSIPQGTKAIGQATYDDATQRIQVHFNTFVYPEGDQHAVQAMAMEPDGSAGLSGDYHSQGGKRELGNFLGNFVSGFANGMEDRAATEFGVPYEIGSIRDGVLNGVSLSSQNEAKMLSDDLAKSKPYMTLSGGQSFIIYLEREYLP